MVINEGWLEKMRAVGRFGVTLALLLTIISIGVAFFCLAAAYVLALMAVYILYEVVSGLSHMSNKLQAEWREQTFGPDGPLGRL